MTVVGSDVADLRSLATLFERAVESLEMTAATTTANLSSTTWAGPDAERYRGQWHSQSRAAVGKAVAALGNAAVDLRRNAAEQEAASAAPGGSNASSAGAGSASPRSGWPSGPLSSPLVDARDFLNSNVLWPITWGTGLGVFDRLGVLPLIDALGLASDTRISPEEKIISAGNSLTDLTGGLIKGQGGPIGYLAGVAIQQWGDVVANAARADFSPSAVKTVTDYIAADPGAAFTAAADAVRDYVPKLFSNLLP